MARHTVLLIIATLLFQTPPSVVRADGAVTFSRGFNAFPWIYRARILNNDVKQFNFDDTFPNIDVFTQQAFQKLRDSGADVIRAPVEPSPFLAANPEQRARLISQVIRATDRITRLGMTMIVQLYPRESVPAWTSTVIMNTPALRAGYKALSVELAKALKEHGGKVVLELMNEPPTGWGYFEKASWFDLQAEMVHEIRAVAPRLTLLLTGDKGGGVDGLMRFDPSSVDDPYMLYSFHYYTPMIVTHQGATWGSNPFRRFFSGIEYPPDPANRDARRADLEERMQTGATSDEKSRAIKDLEAYYAGVGGPKDIAADFARVLDWAKRYGIASSRVVLGEFGVMRPTAPFDTTLKWTRDVRTAAEKAGFAWIYFNYAPFFQPTGDFSVLRMRDAAPNDFDVDIFETGLGMKAPVNR